MFIKNVTIGSDPEVFLRNKKTKEVVTAEGIIKGTKDNPYNFDEEDPFACTSLDCVLAEFNIAPAKTKAEFFRGMEKALNYINNIIPEDLEIAIIPAARLKEKYLKSETAQRFGCSSDLNSWTNTINEVPIPNGNLRSAGLHIAVGYDEPNEYANLMGVKAMDLFLSVPSIIQEPDNERKKLYGKAGAFRHTIFGFEYRSLSNYILEDQNKLGWAYDQTQSAIDFVNKGLIYLLDDEADIIISAINDKDEEKAKYLIDKFKIKLAA
jgi:hypothetical protein